MNRIIVVADAGRVRIFSVARDEGRRTWRLDPHGESLNARMDDGPPPEGASRTRTNTNRQAGPVHPITARREHHSLELDRRFVDEAAKRLKALVAGWREGAIVLVAEPRMLGLMRESLQDQLPPSVELAELARDYAHLTPVEILDRLVDARAIT